MKMYRATAEERRKYRTRASLKGTERCRLSVFRSERHIYVQAIDDQKGVTLASASSLEKICPTKGNRHGAQWVGDQIAQRLLACGISKVVFDRGSYRFHGRVKELADAARSKGLDF